MLLTLRRLLSETLILLVAGVAFALLANQLSPRGLSLTRDYFARAKTPPATSQPPADSPPPAAVAPAPPGAGEIDPAIQRQLEERGIGVVTTAEVEQLFRDPRYDQEILVFIDARNDRAYGEGHIPGAYQFDRYYPERYLPEVLPAVLNAEKIIVYCTGGKCEDSEFAAITLVEAGIPAERIAVYLGGITDWAARDLPVETGARRSGLLRASAP